MFRRSLGNRIILFLGGLALLLGGGELLAVHFFAESNARTQVSRELATGTRVFEHVLAAKAQRLQQAAAVLAADFGFREAVATNDRETLISALANHGRRIQADLMMMVDLHGQVTASTVPLQGAPAAFPAPALLEEARLAGRVTGVIAQADTVYELVLVAVRAPDVIGWVAMGFRVDDTLARELGELAGLEVTFMTRTAGSGYRLAGTTLERAARPARAAELAALLNGPVRTPPAPVEDASRLSTWMPLSTGGAADVVVVLQRALADARHAADRLRWFLFSLIVLAGGIALAGSTVIARGVTQPLRKLGLAAQSISGGDYSTDIAVAADDEVGALAKAFNAMRAAIAARESTIMDLAYRDALTGLPNRALLNDRCQQALARARRGGQPVSLLVLDLDDFQLVNSTLGHAYGDQVLNGVAIRLQGVLARKSDTLARLGGDEFAILLPDADAPAARRTAMRVLLALEAPLEISGHVVDVAGSIGIVTFPADGDDVPTLLSRADLCVSVAKRTRAGCAEYDPRYDQSPERLTLLSELRAAVEGNQLTLFYQPKIDLASDQPVQVEALVRWHYPSRGFVPPDQFIPFAEQTGYIRAITQWVLDAGCAQLARWRATGRDLNLCINVSARDLLNGDLPALVLSTLARHDVPASCLWLEITESSIMDDPLKAEDTLRRLDELGLHLSIDDFGTGYSSLAYLKRLPVDELKIDKTFVLNMDRDEDDAIIVRSTIDLGHNMGLKVVAEGVDHAETLAMLTRWGCDIAQGYYISKPLPADALERWLEARRPGLSVAAPRAVSAA